VLEFSSPETAGWVGELEWPKKVARLLEIGSNGENLMNQVLHADNAKFSEVIFNELIIGEGNALLVDFPVAALVDQLSDRLQVRVAVGDIRVDDGKHLLCGLGKTNEHAIVDLKESKELKDLAGFGGDLADTLDTDNKDQLGLLIDEEGPILFAHASEADLLTLSIAVSLDVRLSTFENDATLLFVRLLSLLNLCGALFPGLFLALALLQQGFGDKDLILGWYSAVWKEAISSVGSAKGSGTRRVGTAASRAAFSDCYLVNSTN